MCYMYDVHMRSYFQLIFYVYTQTFMYTQTLLVTTTDITQIWDTVFHLIVYILLAK